MGYPEGLEPVLCRSARLLIFINITPVFAAASRHRSSSSSSPQRCVGGYVGCGLCITSSSGQPAHLRNGICPLRSIYYVLVSEKDRKQSGNLGSRISPGDDGHFFFFGVVPWLRVDSNGGLLLRSPLKGYVLGGKIYYYYCTTHS